MLRKVVVPWDIHVLFLVRSIDVGVGGCLDEELAVSTHPEGPCYLVEYDSRYQGHVGHWCIGFMETPHRNEGIVASY